MNLDKSQIQIVPKFQHILLLKKTLEMGAVSVEITYIASVGDLRFFSPKAIKKVSLCAIHLFPSTGNVESSESLGLVSLPV